MQEVEGWIRSPQLWVSVVVVVATFAATTFLSRASKRYIRQARLEGKRVTNAQVFISLLQYGIYICAVLTVLQVNGINMTALAASLGLATAAVAFAVQDVLKDLIMGANIMSSGFFSVGDTVKFGEIYGVVQTFNIRATQIYDVNSGNIFSVCNRDITQIERVSDWLGIGVPMSYEVPAEQAREVCRELCQEFQKLPEVTSCEFLGTDSFQDSFISYRILIHCRPDRKNQARRGALGLVQDVFQRRGLTVPYQQIDVHMDTVRSHDRP